MEDTVRLEIDAPVETVARLLADPGNTMKWMDDVVYQPLSGSPGMPGSTYRLLSKSRGPSFIATVVERDLPRESRLTLDAPEVTVSVRSNLTRLTPERTELVSVETFVFHGVFSRIFGLFARPVIRKAHRHHMESFKRFAETHEA